MTLFQFAQSLPRFLNFRARQPCRVGYITYYDAGHTAADTPARYTPTGEIATLGAVRHPLNSPIGRFGIDTLDASDQRCVASMPAYGMTNPLTGDSTLAALTVLVDHACGLVNHVRRAPDEWTVSTELTLELSPEAAATIAARPDIRVVATARPTGEKGDTALGRCRLSHGPTVIGVGTVRSVHLHAPEAAAAAPDLTSVYGLPSDTSARHGLADMMAVTVPEDSSGAAANTPA